MAWAFKELDYPEAVPRLIELLDDENRQVRRAAAEALAEKKDPAAIPSLHAIAEAERFVGQVEVACAEGSTADEAWARLAADVDLDSARGNDKRPAYVKLAVPDDFVKALRGPADRRRDLWLLVRVPKEVQERSESRIVLPHEVG